MTRLNLEPFTSRTDDIVLKELRQRLSQTVWLDAPAGLGRSAGVDVHELRDLVAYWADGFDWPAAEARLNRLPRTRPTLGGLGIHMVHARGRRESGGVRPMPLLLAHGWPDSFWRYSEVVPLLADPRSFGADPADAFDVVVPDMPGYGYSDAAAPDLGVAGVAVLWARLMHHLGYERFAVAGGDLGSAVVHRLALNEPQRVVALHRTDAETSWTGDPASLTSTEREWLIASDRWDREEGAYAALQRTKPQTAAVGLTDSPAGLAGWIVEKLQAWSDHHSDCTSLLSRDAMLTNVTIYWLTRTIGSSMWMYRARDTTHQASSPRELTVPVGYTLFPADIEAPAPDTWLEQTTPNLAYVSRPERGGHFAPLEDPERYAWELREFFRPYRQG